MLNWLELTVGVAANPINAKVHLRMIGLIKQEQLAASYNDGEFFCKKHFYHSMLTIVQKGWSTMIDCWPNLVGCQSEDGFHPILIAANRYHPVSRGQNINNI